MTVAPRFDIDMDAFWHDPYPTLARMRDEGDVAAAIARGPLIARGNGRAYGDSAVSPGLTLDMRGMDRMLSFDPETGVLVAEAGGTVSDLAGGTRHFESGNVVAGNLKVHRAMVQALKSHLNESLPC